MINETILPDQNLSAIRFTQLGNNASAFGELV